MKITIGQTAEGKHVGFDLDMLITTRLLIQANSGAGKSYLLRKLMEQLFGHIQVICLDPEGEFATLREKFGFVLVGKGGETPADPRIAADVAEKLLELRAPAVCDLYEMKPSEQHQWVQNFLHALIYAPKKLWHPAIIIVDEAQMFCPQEGESVASEAMVELTTKGRKRGFCAVWATQRLAKVDKDATSMLLNRLVGGTFEDVDVKRALDLLSVLPEEKREMKQELRVLDPGWFYAFGRAVSKERVLFKVGKVETSHPKPGSSKHAAEPPPAPEAVAKLLPSLADLPQAAEEKARTLAEMKKQLHALQTENRSLKRQQATDAPHAIDSQAVKRQMQAAAREVVAARDQQWLSAVHDYMKRAETQVTDLARKLILSANARFDPPAALPPQRPAPPARVTQAPNGKLSAAQTRILSRLVELLEARGVERVPKAQLAAWSEYSPTGGGYANYLGGLRSMGLIDYPAPGLIAITDTGRELASPAEVPATSNQMLARAKSVLNGSEARILEAAWKVYPQAISKADLAEQTGFSHEGGGYANYLGHMRSLGFIEYPQKGIVRVTDWMFLAD
jgi:hypothetical protein